MTNTKINELILKGNVKGKNSNDSKSGSNSPPTDKESLIEECLERMKNYLKYESES